jgi:hypothetical protein
VGVPRIQVIECVRITVADATNQLLCIRNG